MFVRIRTREARAALFPAPLFCHPENKAAGGLAAAGEHKIWARDAMAGVQTAMPVEEALTRGPLVLVAAHPDDETVGAGGLLMRLAEPAIVHVTDGAPRNLKDARAAGFETREDYALARRRELLNALRLARVTQHQTYQLPVADQEASLDMAGLAHRLADLLRELRRGTVLTHSYEGGHPDHDATAFAVHAACAMLPAAPEIYEFTCYHACKNGIETGRFLIDEEPGEPIQLSNREIERKREMMECFATQIAMMRQFPVDVERFRPAPAYDFTQPPHPGRLFYEHFDWGMTGARWRELAAESLRQLGMAATL